MILWGHPYSRAHRVMWMLRELDLRFEHVPTNFMSGETREPAFLRVNPNGRVPVLDDDGFVIFESLAINLYLSRKYGGDTAARGLVEEAQAVQWSLWEAAEIEKPLLFAAANLFLFPEDQRDPGLAAIGLSKLERPFGVLEALLTERPYLLGDRFTVADLNVAGPMSLIPLAGVPIDRYPRLSDWLMRCLERPAADDWKPIRFTIPRPPTPEKLLAMFL
ncbi:glutathione S-transferase family protein [Sphingomonas sp.]|jgi:glutathione S-transferase|uniref:glutathione S-transferase family protein n=1 Tax=Sphingomonas sp. TaxID=28214 RepID=UPI002D7E828F|nr:glutathione S-transferase family protein [Sphingomonas sp.]HEU0045399.1 glutathione S-transferase family protein [Sphingomonas sp.]